VGASKEVRALAELEELVEVAESAGFGFGDRLDELRTHTTEWLTARRDVLVREQRRLRVEELAVTRVLDERHVERAPEPGLTHRAAREELEVARALETMPAIAQTAACGALSWDQLKGVVEVATPATDAEWAQRAPNIAAADLARQARAAKTVTPVDAAARRGARELRCWSEPDAGMIAGRFRLPDVDGVLVKNVLEEMAGRMRPDTGDAWDRLEHRLADALVDLAQNYADVTPTRRSRPLLVVHVTGETAEIEGIPLAPTTVEHFRQEARVVEQHDDAPVIDHGPGRAAIPAELARAVEHRDPHCRYPGCDRTRALQRHHLTPVAWDGTTSRKTIVRLCTTHHQRMEPHGSERLVGDPDRPDGLRLVRVDRRTDAAARAGPARHRERTVAQRTKSRRGARRDTRPNGRDLRQAGSGGDGLYAGEVARPDGVDGAGGRDQPEVRVGRDRVVAQAEAGLLREAVLLPGVAGTARRDDVLPAVGAAP
jgi:hypothetical protein